MACHHPTPRDADCHLAALDDKDVSSPLGSCRILLTRGTPSWGSAHRLLGSHECCSSLQVRRPRGLRRKTLLRQLGTGAPEAGATPQLLPLKGEQGGQLSPHFLSGRTQNSPGPLIWQLPVHTQSGPSLSSNDGL